MSAHLAQSDAALSVGLEGRVVLYGDRFFQELHKILLEPDAAVEQPDVHETLHLQLPRYLQFVLRALLYQVLALLQTLEELVRLLNAKMVHAQV